MTSGTPINCSVTLESTSSAIVDLCKQILSKLEANGFSQEDIFAVHLALEEAFINAIKHGNKMSPDKEVRIEYSVDAYKVEISMIDEGGGFDPNSVPDPRSGKNIYRTEGRGLLLIHSYMDVVEFNESGNRVRMLRYKEKPHLTEAQSRLQA